MNKRVIIDVGLTEERVVVIEAGRLVEIHIERIEDDKIVGNIYKGKVTNVLPGIEATILILISKLFWIKLKLARR
jgi:ribonuclease G